MGSTKLNPDEALLSGLMHSGARTHLADVVIVALPLPSVINDDATLGAVLESTRADQRLGLSLEDTAAVLLEADEQIKEMRSALGG